MNARVVHVIQSIGFAGVEQHVRRLATAQAAAGGDVVVIGGRRAEMTADTSAGGAGFEHRPGDTALQAARSLWDAIAVGPAPVIHAHMTVAESVAALVTLRFRAPVVCTRHFARPRGSSLPSRWFASGLGRQITAQIAISAYVADHIDGPSTVVLPGVPSRPDGLSAQDRAPVVLVAQRLEAEKRTDQALAAFAGSGLAELGWRLDVAGEGAEHAALQHEAKALGISSATRFLGHRSDVGQLMGRAAILLAPCPVEGLGLTVLEAMAEGLPVIAAGAGGHLETVGSVPGAPLFDPGDTDAAVGLLRALAGDPERRRVLGRDLQLAQRRQFTPAAQAAATGAVYRRSIAAQRNPA